MVSYSVAYLASPGKSFPGLWGRAGEEEERSPGAGDLSMSSAGSSGAASPAGKSASSGDDAVESPSPPPRPLRTQGGPVLVSLDAEGKRHEKPPHSYIALISQAILGAPGKKLLLGDIYQYVMDNYQYYQHVADKAWRNSIRHNLSLNECFIKSGRADNGKGNYWAIHPACVDDFSKGDYRRRQARRRARRSTVGVSQLPMSHRYNLGYVPMTAMPTGLGMGMAYRQYPYPPPTYNYVPTSVGIPCSPNPTASSAVPFNTSPPSCSYTNPASYMPGTVPASPYTNMTAAVNKSQMSQLSQMSQMSQMSQLSQMPQMSQMTHMPHMHQMTSSQVSPPSYSQQTYRQQDYSHLSQLNISSIKEMPALRDAIFSMAGMNPAQSVPSMAPYST